MGSFWWLLESAPDGILIVDSDGAIMLVNAEAEKLFGYTEDELIDKPVEILIPQRFRERHVEHRAAYAAAPRTRPMGIGLELYGLRRDGSDFPVEISLSPVQTKKGLLAMAIVRDVTDYKRARFISETLQRVLFPSQEVSGLKIAYSYPPHTPEPLSEVTSLMFSPLSRAVGIAIENVSGKESSLGALRWLDRSEPMPIGPVPSSVLEAEQHGLPPVRPNSFTTLFYGLLNMRQRTFSFASAERAASPPN